MKEANLQTTHSVSRASAFHAAASSAWSTDGPRSAAQRRAEAWVSASARTAQLQAIHGLVNGPVSQPPRQALLSPPMGSVGAVAQLGIDEAVQAVIDNDKKKFKQEFRGMDPGQDEMISCEVTFEQARKIYSETGKKAEVADFLRQSDELRFPTSHMAHHVYDEDDEKQQFVHPTSADTLAYGAPLSAKGNPRWLGHTSFDRSRAHYVRGASDVDEMRDRAIEYSLNHGAQPPFASNSVVDLDLDDDEAMSAHEQRERLKAKHSSFDPTSTQSISAPWYPGGNDGGVSPKREMDTDSDDDSDSDG